MLKIAVLISGNGSNLQTIIDNVKSGALSCSIEMVISDRPYVYGLERAAQSGIETHVVDRKVPGQTLSDQILKLVEGRADLIVLAGFLSVLSGELLKHYKNRMINIHPALIPSFCGGGMYGIKVHQAAIDYGVKVSGCTVHFVDEGTDTGPILLQKVVPVYASDDALQLQKRVLTQEHIALSEAVKLICEGRVLVEGRMVAIK